MFEICVKELGSNVVFFISLTKIVSTTNCKYGFDMSMEILVTYISRTLES